MNRRKSIGPLGTDNLRLVSGILKVHGSQGN